MSEENIETTNATEQASEAELAEDALSETEGLEGAGKRTMGVERWVQLAFMAIALACIWFYSHLIQTAWYFFADPDESIVTAAAVVGGIGTAIALHANAKVKSLATEVADELVKVSWPTRQETSSSTVVVIVTSIIAAAMLGFFDAIWSALTDLVYKV